MKATEYTDLTKRFKEVIDEDNNLLGVSAKISRIIKNCLESLIKKDQENKLILDEN
jgi:putative methionine-R-sulfoxide reductase with GAF domain